jgi:hypothetical protein
MSDNQSIFKNQIDKLKTLPPEYQKAIGLELSRQIADLRERHKEFEKRCPILGFAMNPLWDKAGWKATTYKFHPTNEAPPVMGICFKDPEAGRAIFQDLKKNFNQLDRFEELRISIIEGSPQGQQFGYSVHLGPDPENLKAIAEGEGIELDPRYLALTGRWTRAYPIPGNPPLLPRFKEEFEKHKQYMLAPVLSRDGKEYADSKLGIIKRTVEFRQLEDITPEDIDAAALTMPLLILP